MPSLEPVSRTKIQKFSLNIEHFEVIIARSAGTLLELCRAMLVQILHTVL
jgi:hypothetical protein